LLGSLQGKKHPLLLFTDIHETPGYRGHARKPWSEYEGQIIADGRYALSIDFSKGTSVDRDSYRARAAKGLGLAYQLTRDRKYAQKARDALLRMRTCREGTGTPKTGGAEAVMEYCLAYDWIQPTLDARTDDILRDKLAEYAADAYSDLNDGGRDVIYVTFADYHGRAYPALGIAACALADYANPNRLRLSSTPADWLRAATEYIFVNDKLHNHNRSLLSFVTDPQGFYLSGAYRQYSLNQYLLWFSVYQHLFRRNILEDYPASKRFLLADLWATLPNRYQSNNGTSGENLYANVRAGLHLLDPQWQGYMLKYLDDLKPILPHAGGITQAESYLLYLVENDCGRLARKEPDWTSVLHRAGQFQVFRGSWKEDSDWLALVTWNWLTHSNRDMAHHDQLGFEYYSHGDLLLADGGEVKHLFETHYSGLDHNCLEIEDPRRPLPKECGAERPGIYLTRARPAFKGDARGLVTAATVGEVVRTRGLDFLEARATIRDVVGVDWADKQPLSSAIAYCRAVLYVRGDYFIILDDPQGEAPWSYSSVLRPVSQVITATSDGNREGGVGHVQGELTLGDKPYDWLSQPYKVERATGIQTSSLHWKTTNPYGRKVLLHIYSAPAAEIIATKHTTRIAGYNLPSEVFCPKLRLRTPPAKDLYRLTALLARYEGQPQREVTETQVTGRGRALRLSLGDAVDLVGVGQAAAPLEFGGVSTDGAFSFVRDRGGKTELALLLHGRKLTHHQRFVVSANVPVRHAAFCFADRRITGHVNLEHAGKVAVPCAFAVQEASYRPDPTDGFVWSESGKGTALPCRTQEGTLVVDVPAGAGSIAVH
jgi:hypothetical protein